MMKNMTDTKRATVILPYELWAMARSEGYSLSRVLRAALEKKFEQKAPGENK
jgi:hypothetical protein